MFKEYAGDQPPWDGGIPLSFQNLTFKSKFSLYLRIPWIRLEPIVI